MRVAHGNQIHGSCHVHRHVVSVFFRAVCGINNLDRKLSQHGFCLMHEGMSYKIQGIRNAEENLCNHVIDPSYSHNK